MSDQNNGDSNLESLCGPIVYRYTRAQAIEDGVLVDVTETAREAGFVYPVVLTSAAWESFVAWATEDGTGQDEQGRLWDVLWMGMDSIRRTTNPGSELLYPVRRIKRGKTVATNGLLKLHIGPGDSTEPVITIMLPHED